jgi:hypothetical protein
MSLRDAVSGILCQMKEDIQESWGDCETTVRNLLKGYIRVLEISLRATEGEQSKPQSQAYTPDPSHPNYTRWMVDQVRGEFSHSDKKAELEESFEPVMREIADGPARGDPDTPNFAPCHINMEVGNKTKLGKATYELREDGKLWFAPSVTGSGPERPNKVILGS